MKSNRIVATFIVALLSLLFAMACRDTDEAGPEPVVNRLDEIVIRGVLRVGMSASIPGAMRGTSDEWIGFEIDVASRLADDLGVDVEFIETSLSTIIPSLLEGSFDVIINGMAIRSDRNLSVNFSLPYDYAGVSLVANRDRAPDRFSLEDFNDDLTVIAARRRSSGSGVAARHLPDAELLLFDDDSQAFNALINGGIDALLAEAPNPAYYAADNPEVLYQPFAGTITSWPIGIALPKGDIDLLNFFDSWIRVVEAEGWLSERKQYWYQTKDWAGKLGSPLTRK